MKGLFLPFFLIHATNAFFEASDIPKIRKCCREDEVYDVSDRSCIRWEDDDNNLFRITYWDDEAVEKTSEKKFEFVGNKGLPSECEKSYYYSVVNGEESEDDYTDYYGQLAEWALLKGNDGENSLFVTEFVDILNTTDFCFDRGITRDGLFLGSTAVFCKLKILCDDEETLCIRTACPPSLTLNPENLTCYLESSQQQWKPEVKIETPIRNVELVFEELSCPRVHHYSSSSKPYMIDSKGHIHIAGGIYNTSLYSITRSFNNEHFEEDILICAPQEYDIDDINFLGTKLVVICCFLSAISLGLSWYNLFRHKKHKLFGIMTLNMVTSMFWFYVFLIIPAIFHENLVTDYPILCTVIGFLIQFTYQSSIFWLNVMAFDIWDTFRQIQKIYEKSGSRKRSARFKYYAVYAWGGPALVTSVTLLMQFLPKDLTEDLVVTPRMGETRCFLEKGAAMLFYFHIINGPILLLNVCFFLGSMWNLVWGVWAAAADSRRFPRRNGGDLIIRAHHHRNHSRYKTVLKLFFAMGVTWIVEFVSWLLDWTSPYGGYRNSYVWITVFLLFDLINALQGVTISCVLSFNHSTIQDIKSTLLKSSSLFYSRRKNNVAISTILTATFPLGTTPRGMLAETLKTSSNKSGGGSSSSNSSSSFEYLRESSIPSASNIIIPPNFRILDGKIVKIY